MRSSRRADRSRNIGIILCQAGAEIASGRFRRLFLRLTGCRSGNISALYATMPVVLKYASSSCVRHMMLMAGQRQNPPLLAVSELVRGVRDRDINRSKCDSHRVPI